MWSSNFPSFTAMPSALSSSVFRAAALFPRDTGLTVFIFASSSSFVLSLLGQLHTRTLIFRRPRTARLHEEKKEKHKN